MIFKFKHKEGPTHIDVVIFAKEEDHVGFIRVGACCFNPDEWRAFRELVGRNAVRLNHHVEFETRD